jgi:hypothetical protein
VTMFAEAMCARDKHRFAAVVPAMGNAIAA